MPNSPKSKSKIFIRAAFQNYGNDFAIAMKITAMHKTPKNMWIISRKFI